MEILLELRVPVIMLTLIMFFIDVFIDWKDEPPAFHKRSLSAGIVQKTGSCPERRGGSGPRESSRGGPRVAPAGRHRGIDRPRSGEPEAPTSSPLGRRRPRRLCAAMHKRRILR